MNRSLLLSAAFIVMAGGAVAQTAAPATPAQGTSSSMAPAQPGKSAAPATATPDTAPSGDSASLSKIDKMFVEKAAEGGLTEVQAAQLAQQKSQNASVKDFAQHMIDDHTPANTKLTTIASGKGLTAPTEPSAAQQKMLAKLGTLDGAKFDHTYITGQVKAHEAMLKLFQREATNGKDADLKSFAETTVPTIQQHITMAQGTK